MGYRSMKFIGRTRELKALEDAYNTRGSTFMPIYGRRRVGKTELIRHFIKDKKALYFLGKQAPARLQIQEFLRRGASAFEQPLLEETSPGDWRSAVSLVIRQAPPGEKVVLVMDEFQWTAQACPEIPSVLQSFIDENWEGRGDIQLILCGSYMGFMEKKVLGEKSPLFGRRTGQIKLEPFSYHEAAEFYPGWSVTDKAKAFFICGGVPYYLKFFDESDSVDMNIRKNFLNEFSALAREPEFLLREELKELRKYFGILTTLASGALKTREISENTGIENRALFYYLNSLIELGYIARHFPLTGAKPNPKHVRYKLQDPLLRFWFRFIYPNGSAIFSTDERSAFLNLIKPGLESYFGRCFESLCREALTRIYREEGVACSYEIGEYWDKNMQIDVVGHRRDGVVDIGECKWGGIGSRARLIRELRNKMASYPNIGNNSVKGRLFIRSAKVDPGEAGIRVHTLDDLYSSGPDNSTARIGSKGG